MFATQEWNPRTLLHQVSMCLTTHWPNKSSHCQTLELTWHICGSINSVKLSLADLRKRNHCAGSSSLHFFWKWRFAFLSNKIVSMDHFLGFQDLWITPLLPTHREPGTTFRFGSFSDQHAAKEIWWCYSWRRGRILDSFCPTLVHLGDGTGVQEYKIHTSTWRF